MGDVEALSSGWPGPVFPAESVAWPVDIKGTPRRTLLDEAAQATLDRRGAVVVDLFDEEELDHLRSVAESVGSADGDPGSGFFQGYESSSNAWKRAVIAGVEPVVEARLGELFDDHEPYYMTFLTKWPGPRGALPAHQDPTMIAGEGRFRSVTLWCPIDELHDVAGRDRGMLRVVPGSHRLTVSQWCRARGHARSAYEDLPPEVLGELAVPIPLDPGEAVVYDHRLVHSSGPNRSDRPRRVLAIALRPSETVNVDVHCDEQGEVTVHAVDNEFFLRDEAAYGESYAVLASVPRRMPPAVRVDDIRRMAATAGAGGPFEDGPIPISPAPARPPMSFLAVARSGWTGAPAPDWLRDPQLDRRLGRDGFVVTRVLAPGEVEARRRGATGRSGLLERISAATAETWEAMFVGARPVMIDVAHAPAGESEMVIRSDTLTDELQGEGSLRMWLALDDIGPADGCFRVARGSHRLDPGVRGTDLDDRLVSDQRGWNRRMVSVPLRSGEAIIADGALVWGRSAVRSTRAGLLVEVAIVRHGASLVHMRSGRETVSCHRVHSGSLASPLRRAALRRRLLGAPSVDLPPSGAAPLGGGQLRRLDVQPLALRDRLVNITAATRSAAGAGADRARHQLGRVPARLLEGIRRVRGRLRAPSQWLMAADEAMIRASTRRISAVWSPDRFAWVSKVESAWPVIRSEAVALVKENRAPLVADVTGFDQGNEGIWRMLVLKHEGSWVGEHRDSFPGTVAAVAAVPDAVGAAFSVLEPGARLPVHRGPDPGVLRYHLGVVVPDPPELCGLRVGETELQWREGGSLMFDDAALHTAWNRTDQDRVVLAIDVPKPLPLPARLLHALAHAAFLRGDRARAMDRHLGCS